MIRKNKWWILISSAVILLPSVFVLVFRREIEVRASAALGTAPHTLLTMSCLFPVFLLLLHLVCILVTAWDHKKRAQSKTAFRLVLFICPIISFYTTGILITAAIGLSIRYNTVTALLVGIGFLLSGNYLPKCMQNRTVGIKLPWTLQSENNWYKTHRFGGKVFMICGVLVLLAAFLPLEIFFIVLLAVILAAGIIPTVYSYLYYKKELREGTIPTEDACGTAAVRRRISSVLAVILVLAVLAAIFVFASSGGYEITLGADSLTVNATLSDDLTVAFSEIDAVELRAEGVPGERIFGYGAPHLLMGTFRNDEIGLHTRYTYTASNACILLTVGEESVVLSGKTDAETQALYDALTELLK